MTVHFYYNLFYSVPQPIRARESAKAGSRHRWQESVPAKIETSERLNQRFLSVSLVILLSVDISTHSNFNLNVYYKYFNVAETKRADSLLLTSSDDV